MGLWRRTVIESGLGWIAIVNALENEFQDVSEHGPAVLTGLTLGPAGLYSFKTRSTASRQGAFLIAARQGGSRIWLFVGPPLSSFLLVSVAVGLIAGIAARALLGGLISGSAAAGSGVLVGLLVAGGFAVHALLRQDGGDETDTVLVEVMLKASNGRAAPRRPQNTIVN